jgi:hypothetical protein
VAPRGGGPPLVQPVGYQVNALWQVIAKPGETLTGFGHIELDVMLQKLHRTGTDAVCKPLHAITCHQEGLARLTELGEIEGTPWRWNIVSN